MTQPISFSEWSPWGLSKGWTGVGETAGAAAQWPGGSGSGGGNLGVGGIDVEE